MKFPSLSRGALVRLLAVAVAICSVSDGRNSGVRPGQRRPDGGARARGDQSRPLRGSRKYPEAGGGEDAERRCRARARAAVSNAGAPRRGAGAARSHHQPADWSAHHTRRIRADRRAPAPHGQLQLANDAYRLAAERAPNDPAIQTGWGELFLQTHNNAEAVKSFKPRAGG